MTKAIVKGLIYVLLAAGILAMLQIGSEYFMFPVHTSFMQTKYNLLHNSVWHFVLYTHIISSSVCIVFGAFQFSTKLRQTYPRLHKTLGFIYWASILAFAAPSGLYMAIFANGGFWAKCSFVITALLWFIFTAHAIVAIKNNQVNLHQKQMIRSYALTLSAVSLRLLALCLPLIIHLSAKQNYTFIAWLSWIPNLLIAEVIIRFKSQTTVS